MGAEMSGTRVHFVEVLESLRQRLLHMGSVADSMVEQAVKALIEQNSQLAEDVIHRDDEVDQIDLEIEAECMRLIALQQPLARDLRLVGSSMKVITDLERIGDHAVDIAKIARKMARDTFFKPLVDMPHMADRVRYMLHNALMALVNHDLTLVNQVVEADDEVDDLFHKIREELHAAMGRDSSLVVQASYLLFVAHYLERIADHAVNIAERVYYVETGNLATLAKSRHLVS
jgi:phosphate transport system protein